MSGTLMKFGPQWIRTLTDGAASSTASSTQPTNTTTSANNQPSSVTTNTSSTTTTTSSSSSSANPHNNNNNNSLASSNSATFNNTAAGKYKLAEYRYGREEMLALFEHDVDAPEDIRKFLDLYVEKARMPMAMTQMSEEEVKLSTRNWNSEAVLRSSGKIANSIATGGPNQNSNLGQGPGGAAGGSNNSTLNDRDTTGRQMSERGAQGALTAAGVLSSSPRGPPGSLTRIPIEQRGLLSSLNSRGPLSTIRNLVGRGPNLYMRSQSHDDDGGGTNAGSNEDATRFDRRYTPMPDLLRDPNSYRLRFETSRSGAPTSNTKPIDIKAGGTGLSSHPLDGDLSGDRGGTGRSVFDRMPSKYSVDDKVRKDVNGKPVQNNDWRAREWSGNSGLERGASKIASEDRGGSWRSSRTSGTTEDWRNNSTTNTSTTSSSWYVKSEDQRNIRTVGVTGSGMGQENLNSGFSGKRDTLRRPSVDDRHAEEDEEIGNHHQPRHRRDSLPEWSIGDPLAGDKVGSFDASGAFREIARGEDGLLNESNDKNHLNRDQGSNYHQELKSTGVSEQEWRVKVNKVVDVTESRQINSSNSLSEIEKLTLLGRTTTNNSIPIREDQENKQDSRSKHSADVLVRNSRDGQTRDMHKKFSDFQISVHNHESEKQLTDLQSRTSPTLAEIEHKKSVDNSRKSASPQQRLPMNQQSLPPNIRQFIKPFDKDQQANQSFIKSTSRGSSSTNANQQSSSNTNEDDGFAHLERAAEIMVAEWTAEDDQETPNEAAALFENNKLNLTREQQDAQQAMLQSNADARLSNRIQQQQTGSEQQQSTGGNPSALVFDSNNQKKFILLPFNHEDSQQWFYRDTQGVIQGPFNATEMFEWYKAGYFVKELLVRRACDGLFYPLGDLIKLWDRIPFAPLPMNVAPPPPITTQTLLLQMRAVNKQLELALNPGQGPPQIPANSFVAHPGAVLLHGPLLQQQQQQVQQALAAVSLNQNISGPQEQQTGIRQILEATRQHDQAIQQQQQQQRAAAAQGLQNAANVDQNEMQTQLRQLLAQLKNREGFSNLNAQEQQEVLVRQFVASRQGFPGGLQPQQQEQARMVPFIRFFSSEQERFQYQQRMELERKQKEEAEKQTRFIMEQRMKAEEEKQRIMELKRQQKQKEENEKQQQSRQEAEQERILKLSQLKQQQLAKQQEEFRQQMMNQQRMQQEKQQQKQQQQQLSTIQQQQQQQIERAKKAAQAQQVQQEQQRKTAWSTVSKPDQEPVSLATLQKMEEEEKEKEREKQRQIQQQIQSNQQQQQQQLQQQLQRQMTWANAAQQTKPAPIKTLAEIQKEEEERMAREKQKKTKVQPTVTTAGVWNNAASHLSWKNPSSDS